MVFAPFGWPVAASVLGFTFGVNAIAADEDEMLASGPNHIDATHKTTNGKHMSVNRQIEQRVTDWHTVNCSKTIIA